MAINPLEMMKLGERFKIFSSQHPKVTPFIQTVSRDAIREGSVLELKVTDPEGKEYVTNIRVTAEDMETVNILKNMKG